MALQIRTVASVLKARKRTKRQGYLVNVLLCCGLCLFQSVQCGGAVGTSLDLMGQWWIIPPAVRWEVPQKCWCVCWWGLPLLALDNRLLWLPLPASSCSDFIPLVLPQSTTFSLGYATLPNIYSLKSHPLLVSRLNWIDASLDWLISQNSIQLS